MKRLLSVMVVLALLPVARAEEKKEENPYKNAKVGDWIEYKTTVTLGEVKVPGTMKMVVADKNEKEVTLKTVLTAAGMEVPAPDMKVDLTKPYDPLATANLPNGTDAKVEKLGEGKEKIKVGGKEHDAEWTKMKVTGKAQGIDMTGDVKVWTSKMVPLGGMVKMDMVGKAIGMDFKMEMELTGFGSK
jgi:hypothetical protein